MTDTRKLPIIMSTPMVRAHLRQEKTQTRRTRDLEHFSAEARVVGYETRRGDFYVNVQDRGDFSVRCSYGGPGRTLYVREGIRRVTDTMRADRLLEDEFDPMPLKRMHDAAGEYIADGHPAPIDSWVWKNSALPAIHMPFGCRRFELDLRTVTVERLKDITTADAIAEGTRCWVCGGRVDGTSEEDCECFHTKSSAVASYQVLWEEINGPGSWDRNPLVWRLEYAPRKLR